MSLPTTDGTYRATTKWTCDCGCNRIAIEINEESDEMAAVCAHCGADKDINTIARHTWVGANTPAKLAVTAKLKKRKPRPIDTLKELRDKLKSQLKEVTDEMREAALSDPVVRARAKCRMIAACQTMMHFLSEEDSTALTGDALSNNELAFIKHISMMPMPKEIIWRAERSKGKITSKEHYAKQVERLTANLARAKRNLREVSND